MTSPLTTRQRRSFNRAGKAITELAKEAAHSEPLTALMLGLLTHSAGTMVGIGCRINELDRETAEDTAEGIAREVKTAAMRAYAKEEEGKG